MTNASKKRMKSLNSLAEDKREIVVANRKSNYDKICVTQKLHTN